MDTMSAPSIHLAKFTKAIANIVKTTSESLERGDITFDQACDDLACYVHSLATASNLGGNTVLHVTERARNTTPQPVTKPAGAPMCSEHTSEERAK